MGNSDKIDYNKKLGVEGVFDFRRNLWLHEQKLEEKLKKGEKPQGNCELCAKVDCLTNVTKKSVLDAFGAMDFDAVEQIDCDDYDEDLLIEVDLRDSNTAPVDGKRKINLGGGTYIEMTHEFKEYLKKNG